MSDMHKLKQKLEIIFVLGDLGDPKQFQNMELNCTAERLTIRQKNSIKNLMENAGMLTCTPQPRSMSPCHRLNERTTSASEENGDLYHSHIGNLLYLATKSRPDVCLIPSTLGSYIADHRCSTKVEKQELRYLVETCNAELHINPGGGVLLSAHIDAN